MIEEVRVGLKLYMKSCKILRVEYITCTYSRVLKTKKISKLPLSQMQGNLTPPKVLLVFVAAIVDKKGKTEKILQSKRLKHSA